MVHSIFGENSIEDTFKLFCNSHLIEYFTRIKKIQSLSEVVAILYFSLSAFWFILVLFGGCFYKLIQIFDTHNKGPAFFYKTSPLLKLKTKYL